MTDFEAILDQLEELSRPVDRTNPLRAASLADAFDGRANDVERDGMVKSRVAFVAAAYGRLSPEPRKENDDASRVTKARAPRLPDKESLIRELRLAENSLDDLRALRRKLAWLCHPDRHESVDA
ncbi:MAG: hypothetical protein C3F11_08320, partial [Methylocystaceae bacterium]